MCPYDEMCLYNKMWLYDIMRLNDEMCLYNRMRTYREVVWVRMCAYQNVHLDTYMNSVRCNYYLARARGEHVNPLFRSKALIITNDDCSANYNTMDDTRRQETPFV